jgi:uncharacterized membrane protein YkvA (DUF1232 family)
MIVVTAMKNIFFANALRKAAGMAGKPARLLVLFSKLALKLKTIDWKNVKASDVKERFLLLGRLIKAYASGEYRNIPWKSLLLVLAAVIYFINPIDLLPDLVPFVGLTDDFAILVWLYNTVNIEIDKFLVWEQQQITS